MQGYKRRMRIFFGRGAVRRRAPHLRKTAVAVGAVMSSLVAAGVQARQEAHAASVTPAEKSAVTCANSDLVYKPRSAFPSTTSGTAAYLVQNLRIRQAVLCLVNGERAARGLAALSGSSAGAAKLYSAALGHVNESVRLKWWGSSSPHVNPQTGSTILSRAKAAGYTTGCRSFTVKENTYTGWGAAKVTPRAAVKWWMGSAGHRATILDRALKDTGVAVAWGSADKAAGSITPAVSYVQMFGVCTR